MSSDATYGKGACTHCGGHIEFPREALGAEVACPHCGATTALLDNLAPSPAESAPPLPGPTAPPAVPRTNPAAGAPAKAKGAGAAPKAGNSFSRECPGCSLEVSIKADACPSCGAILREKRGLNLKLLVPVALLVVAVGGFFAFKSGLLKLPARGSSGGDAGSTSTKPTAPPKPVKRSGKFELVGHQIEKTPGTSLIYVVGSVSNGTDKQKFSVRVTFALTDKAGKPAGEATDYITVIEPGDTWNFRALILDSAAENAKLTSLDAENP
jgi:predicted RNA-binding Zn-ribbon protein involved in translation (DUF1610 family)